jgi:hypothetical protein
VFTRTGSGRTEGKTQEKDDLFVSQALTQKQNEQYDQFASLLEKQAAQSSQRVKEFQDQGQVEAAAVRQNQANWLALGAISLRLSRACLGN